MADFSNLFAGTTTSKKTKTMNIKFLDYTELDRNMHQYCDAGEEEIIFLASIIEADGKILQNLIVRPKEDGRYEIIAGHKRCQAAKYLVENRGLTQFSTIPCHIVQSDDIRSRFAVVSTNVRHTKTAAEIVHEIEEMTFLIKNFPESFPDYEGGRLVEYLATQLNMSRSTVSEYLNISHNLSENGKEALAAGEIKKSAAVEMCSLSEREQEALINDKKTSIADVKKYKKEKKDKIQETKDDVPESGTIKNNGFKIMADSYRRLVDNGTIHEADKEIRIFDFLSTCDENDICLLFDSSAFNDLAMAYVRKAAIELENENVISKKQSLAVKYRVKSFFDSITAEEIMEL